MRTHRLIVFVAIAVSACNRQQAGSDVPQRDEREQQVAALAQKRETHARELAAMDITRLAQELQAESIRGLEPFNSMSYSEAVRRGRDAAGQLAPLLRDSTRNSFLGLLAVRAADSTRYASLTPAFRVSVLVDALRNARTFNAWGLPHSYWEDAAKALIAEGRAADAALRPLLDDTRPAPVWGSEEVVESQRYGYRVRDYAWGILRAIRGEQGEIPTNPAARDSLIAALQRRPR